MEYQDRNLKYRSHYIILIKTNTGVDMIDIWIDALAIIFHFLPSTVCCKTRMLPHLASSLSSCRSCFCCVADAYPPVHVDTHQPPLRHSVSDHLVGRLWKSLLMSQSNAGLCGFPCTHTLTHTNTHGVEAVCLIDEPS